MSTWHDNIYTAEEGRVTGQKILLYKDMCVHHDYTSYNQHMDAIVSMKEHRLLILTYGIYFRQRAVSNINEIKVGDATPPATYLKNSVVPVQRSSFPIGD